MNKTSTSLYGVRQVYSRNGTSARCMVFSVHIVGCLDLSKDCLWYDFAVFNRAMFGLTCYLSALCTITSKVGRK